jgi:hypothetical protein
MILNLPSNSIYQDAFSLDSELCSGVDFCPVEEGQIRKFLCSASREAMLFLRLSGESKANPGILGLRGGYGCISKEGAMGAQAASRAGIVSSVVGVTVALFTGEMLLPKSAYSQPFRS